MLKLFTSIFQIAKLNFKTQTHSCTYWNTSIGTCPMCRTISANQLIMQQFYIAYVCHIYSRWACKLKCANVRKQIFMVIVHVGNLALYLAYVIIHNDKSRHCVSLPLVHVTRYIVTFTWALQYVTTTPISVCTMHRYVWWTTYYV